MILTPEQIKAYFWRIIKSKYIDYIQKWNIFSSIAYDYTENGQLAPGTKYTVTIENSAFDQGGQTMEESFTWTFTTGTDEDNDSPTIVITPSDGSVDVPSASVIEIEFSEAMDMTTINKEGLLVRSIGLGSIDGDILYDYNDEKGKWTLTFDPYKGFAGGEEITVTAPEGWRDMAGNELAGELSASFSIARSSDVYFVSSSDFDLAITF